MTGSIGPMATAAQRRKKDSTSYVAESSRPADYCESPPHFADRGCMPDAPPSAAPSFTLADIRAVIPKHCFERSLLTSCWHVVKGAAAIAVLATAAAWGLPGLPLAWQVLLWPVYWFFTGAFLFGLWVIAHEAGHGAFSTNDVLNDVVGFVMHSAALAPYFSWKYTHATHHKFTNSCEHDAVYVPPSRSEVLGEALSDAPLVLAVGLLRMVLLGWPIYLFLNITGPSKYAHAINDHANPFSALFTDAQRVWVAVSDVGVLVALAGLWWACGVWGYGTMALMLGGPYLVMNAFLVIVTYLQHTDVYIPHLREGTFTWLRGALCTADRTYGWPLDDAMCHITDAHVVHHLFSVDVPHYHAKEATAAMRPLLGKYYLRDDTPWVQALWRAWTRCRFVEDGGGLVYVRDAAAFAAGPPPAK